MILTGPEIARRRAAGEIVISPFSEKNLNPNSYNFCLHPTMTIYSEGVIDPRHAHPTEQIVIGEDGYVLEPRRLYLAATLEELGGEYFVPTYAARSSVARLGLFINLSAPLGDIGFIGRWTIQLFALHPTRVYAGMQIGQMMFWKVAGEIDLYRGKYQGAEGAVASRMHMDFDRKLAANVYGSTAPVEPVSA